MVIEIVKTKLRILLRCCMYPGKSAVCLPRALPYCNKKGSQAYSQNSSQSRPFADRQGRRKCRFCRSKNLSSSSAMSWSVSSILIVILFACILTTRQLLHALPYLLHPCSRIALSDFLYASMLRLCFSLSLT